MSSKTIEEQVVEMKLENSHFKRGVSSTLDALNGLRKALTMRGATDGLKGVDAAANNVNLNPLTRSIETVSGRFSALSVAAVAALGTIVSQATMAGAQFAKSMTIDPVLQGFGEYELKLGSIQTIMNATGESMGTVNGRLDELNTYADKTIYSFSDMTNNIGKFTNAGIDLDTSVKSIQGISNAAALAGAGTNDASRAMFNLSQALSQGSVRLQDWMSIENANMATAGFREELIKSAVAAGTLKKTGDGLWETMEGTEVTVENFRNTLADQWLTSEALTDTLGKYADENSELGKKAFASAQDVKTATQLIGTLKEAVGSGWAQTFEVIIGDFEQAKKLFTTASNSLGDMISAQADARNAMFKDWKSAGGRDAAITAIKNSFEALLKVLSVIKDAFTEIFPPMTGKRLAELSQMVANFTEKLIMSGETTEKVKTFLMGLFAALDIVFTIVKMGVGVLLSLFSVLYDGRSGVLDLASSFGEFLINLRNSIKEGKGLEQFFERVTSFLVPIVKGIRDFFGALIDGFKAVDLSNAADSFDRIGDRMSPLVSLGRVAGAIFKTLFGFVSAVAKSAWDAAQNLGTFFSKVGPQIIDALTNVDYSLVLDSINTGLFAVLALALKKFLDGFSLDSIADKGAGFFSPITDVFEELTGTLSAMQASLKAGTLLKIAGAVALLAASVVALSLIDSEALNKAIAALTILFTQLVASMAILNAVNFSGGLLQLPAVAAGMILLSVAINILALAVKQMSGLDWDEMAKGLTGVAVALGLLVGAAKLLQGNTKGMIVAGAGLILLAAGLKVIASAVGDFAEYSWSELLKGFVAIGAFLAVVAGFAAITAGGSSLVGTGVGLVLISAALKILAGVLGDLGGMSWEEIARGLVALGGALVIIAGAMALLNAGVGGALALIVIAGALRVLVPVLTELGALGWDEIARGLTALGGALIIIAGAMILMSTAIAGAAALIVVATALRLLVPVLQTLGSMSLGEIGMALGALAGVFILLGVAGLTLGPLVPILLGVGAAIGLIGLGVALAGAGVFLFATGLTALAASAGVAAVAFVSFVGAILAVLPMIVRAIGVLLVEIANVVRNAAPAIVGAIEAVISALLGAIIRLAPQVARAFVVVMMSIIQAVNQVTPAIMSTLMRMLALFLALLVNAIPMMVNAGMRILLGILRGIRDNIHQIVTVGGDIIVRFLDAISKQFPRITQKGAETVIKFINSTADAVRNNRTAMNEAGRNLAGAIIDGMTGGLASGLQTVKNKAMDVARAALDAAKRFLGVKSPSKEFFKVGKWSDEGMALGFDRNSRVVEDAARNVGAAAIFAMKKSIAGLSDAVDSELDLQPRITPVLDMSKVRGVRPEFDNRYRLSTEGAYDQAIRSNDVLDNRRMLQTEAAQGTVIKYEQHNTSPKALNAGEIYRQTRNQLSVMKKEIIDA